MESPLPGSIHGTSTFELLAALGRDWTAWAQPAGAAPNFNSSRRGEHGERAVDPPAAALPTDRNLAQQHRAPAGRTGWSRGVAVRLPGPWRLGCTRDLAMAAYASQGGFHPQACNHCCQAASAGGQGSSNLSRPSNRSKSRSKLTSRQPLAIARAARWASVQSRAGSSALRSSW